ncbi:MAG: 50S ribosomal protein L21 [Firmicutes bacterium]|nr:50S ribosomal protein L21 [Bacillota bacterium]
MYAVVMTGGKQYRVSAGDKIRVEKLNAEAGSTVSLDKVLVIGGEGETMVGAPYVAGAFVEAEVVENGKADKVVIFKYKAKKDYRKKQGHRQPYTELKINGISLNGEAKAKAPEAPKAEEVVAEAVEEAVDFKAMKKSELAEFAAAKGIEVDAKLKKEEMIAAIEAALSK